MIASGIKEAARKKAILLHLAEERVNEIFDAMNITFAQNEDVYKKTKEELMKFFKPKKDIHYETFIFRSVRQQQGESMDSYHMRLNGLVKYSEFVDMDKKLLLHIVQTCNSAVVRRRALGDTDITLKG